MPLLGIAAGIAGRYVGAKIGGKIIKRGMSLFGKGRGRTLKRAGKRSLLKKAVLGVGAAAGGYLAYKGAKKVVSMIRGKGEGRGGRKRIDPTNIKALRRATSRLASFSKTMRKVQGALNRLSTKKGYRPHSEGVITSSEARRALRR